MIKQTIYQTTSTSGDMITAIKTSKTILKAAYIAGTLGLTVPLMDAHMHIPVVVVGACHVCTFIISEHVQISTLECAGQGTQS